MWRPVVVWLLCATLCVPAARARVATQRQLLQTVSSSSASSSVSSDGGTNTVTIITSSSGPGAVAEASGSAGGVSLSSTTPPNVASAFRATASFEVPTVTLAPAPAPAPAGTNTSGPLFCACDETYEPVCGQDGATYGNACVLDCTKVPLAYPGKCTRCVQGNKACGCNDRPDSVPVCADGLTWSSACDAECNGHLCHTPGVCNYTSNQPAIEITPVGYLTTSSFSHDTSNTSYPSPTAARYNYAEVLHKTYIFFESQKSGNLSLQRLAWRSDSCADCVGTFGEDLSGGYYESGGSYLKLGIPAAFLVTTMAWGQLAFPDGYAKANETAVAMDATQWGADYLLNAYNETAQTFAAVVGNDTEDFDYYGPPEYYREFVPVRPVFYLNASDPGSEIPAEAAAALAACSILFAGDAAYSLRLLTAAKSLYSFATSNPRSYMNSSSAGIGIHQGLYPSTGFWDELTWAASWLYKATQDVQYLADAQKYYQQWSAQVANYAGYTFENGEKGPALHVLLAQIDPVNGPSFARKAKEFFDQYLGGSIPRTDRGFSMPYHWGATRPTTAAAFLALVHAQAINSTDPQYSARLFNYAQLQINYLLGDSGRSWVVGHGTSYPEYIWHKPSFNSAIDWPTRGQLIWMGLDRAPLDKKTSIPVIKEAGGIQMVANQLPQRHLCYGYLFAAPTFTSDLVLARKDYTYAEATTDGTAAFAGALAGLASYYTSGQTAITDCQLDLGWTHPNATMTAKSVNNTASPCPAPQAATAPAALLVATQG